MGSWFKHRSKVDVHQSLNLQGIFQQFVSGWECRNVEMTTVLAWGPSGKGAPGSSRVGIQGYGDTGKLKIKWSTGKLIQRWHVRMMWISWCRHLPITHQLLGV